MPEPIVSHGVFRLHHPILGACGSLTWLGSDMHRSHGRRQARVPRTSVWVSIVGLLLWLAPVGIAWGKSFCFVLQEKCRNGIPTRWRELCMSFERPIRRRNRLSRSGHSWLGLAAAMLVSGLASAGGLSSDGADSLGIPCYEVAATIQGPPGPFGIPAATQGLGISPNGQYVVGYYDYFGGDGRAWVYRTETQQFSVLPLPPGISSMVANDANDSGLVVGHMGGVSGSFAFVYNLNTNQYLAQIPPIVNAGTSEFKAINASGVACGWRTISEPDLVHNAMVWSAQTGVRDLGVMNGPRSAAMDITDSGIVVGWTGTDGLGLQLHDRGFIYDHGKLTLLPGVGAGGSAAVAMSDQGLIAGVGRIPEPMFAVRAFIYDTMTGQMRVIAPPPELRDSQCGDISADGLAVGSFGGPGAEAFAWRNGNLADLNGLVQSDQFGYVFGPVAISNDWSIVSGNGLSSTALVLRPHTRPSADIDANCVVNMDDVLRVISAWGMRDSPADVDDSGLVDIEDLMIVIHDWNFWL